MPDVKRLPVALHLCRWCQWDWAPSSRSAAHLHRGRCSSLGTPELKCLQSLLLPPCQRVLLLTLRTRAASASTCARSCL